MKYLTNSKNQVSRSKFWDFRLLRLHFQCFPGILLSGSSENQQGNKPNSEFGGVQVGAITYSWRSMPGSAEDILNIVCRLV